MKNKFVDRVCITLSGGRGGPGAVHFHTSSRAFRGGPDGGDGGDGGDVLIKPDERLWDLSFFHRAIYKAEDGKSGRGGKRKGARGKNFVLSVPLHTTCYDEKNQVLYPLCSEEEKKSSDKECQNKAFSLLKGGRGGKGNAFFKSARRQAPRTAQEGARGQTKKIILEMKWFSHLALIGVKGVGKSRLMALCHSYLEGLGKMRSIDLDPFSIYKKEDMKREHKKKSFLGPKLFVLKFQDFYTSLTLVDLPGLNLDSKKFLKQAEKARSLLFVISLKDKDPFLSYQSLIKTLIFYDKKQGTSLLKKPRFLLLKGKKTPDNIKKEKAFNKLNLEDGTLEDFSARSSAQRQNLSNQTGGLSYIRKLSFFSEEEPENIKNLLYFLAQTQKETYK